MVSADLYPSHQGGSRRAQRALWPTYVSKIHDAELAQRRDDFAADLVGNVELGQAHVRRAEQRVLYWRHSGGAAAELLGRGGVE